MSRSQQQRSSSFIAKANFSKGFSLQSSLIEKLKEHASHFHFNTGNLLRMSLVLTGLLLVYSSAEAQKYVKPVATGSGNGSSWDNAHGASSLNADLAAGGTIYIAAGTYTPITGAFSPIAVPAGSVIRGGYPVSASGTDTSGYNPGTNQTIIDGNLGRVLDFASGTYLIKGIIITNSKGGGTGGSAIRGNAGGLFYSWTIQDCVFKNTTGNGADCAVWLNTGGNTAGNLHITNCIFDNNVIIGGAHGPALRLDNFMNVTQTNDGTSFVISGCSFSNNSATGGSPGGALEIGTNRGLNFINCSFCGNHTDNYGGAITSSDGDKLVFDGCSFTGNSNGAEYGGAVRFTGSDNITLNNCVFTNNDGSASAVGAGGAIAIESGSPYTISNCKFYGNMAKQRGGAIVFQGGGSMTITNSVFKANSVSNAIAVTGGGAIYTVSGAGQTLAYNNCVFDANTVVDYPFTTPNSSGGGAISVGGGVSPSTTGSTFYNNSYNGTTTLLKSDIFVYGGGVFTATNCVLQPTQASFNASYIVTTGNTFSNTTNPNVAAAPTITCPTSIVTVSAASFMFNCGTASATGTFVANNTAGQTGSLIIPINGTTAGTASFTVSGSGFSGSLTATLTAGQTSVTIPITYDGTGSAGSVVLTITSAQGSGSCSVNINVLSTMLNVTINQASTQVDPACSKPVAFDVVFSQPINVSSFTTSKISTTGSTAISVTVDSIRQVAPNNGTTFKAYLSALTNGTIVASIPASGITYTPSLFATCGTTPYGMTVDASGNVYVANYGSNNVTKITPAGVSTILGSTGTNPYGIAVDVSGNVFTANASSNTVTKITPAGVSSLFGTTGSAPTGIAIDPSGNIYTANYSGNSVTKITPAGVSTTISTGGTQPRAIAIDAAGNVYVANSGSNNVSKITPLGVASILGTTGTQPFGIAVDAGGNVYTSNFSSLNVSKITPAGASSIYGTNTHQLWGIAIGPSGTIYASSHQGAEVFIIPPSGVSSTIYTGAVGFSPYGIAVDASENIYMANNSSNNVTKIGATPNGISTLTGYYNNASTSVDHTITLNSPCPATFTFNCGSASVNGTFIASGSGGQFGNVSLLLSNTVAGSASFSLSGAGFTGTLSTTLSTGQTFISIPVTYNGTGSPGTVVLSITSSQGSGTCNANATVTAPPASFTFNCSTSSAIGTFVANNTAGQTGSLSIPITGATAGSASFSVSGTGFTGSLSTTLTAGQTSVSIPVTYDGTGSAGSVVLTITSAQGTGTCTTNVTVTAPVGSFTFNCGTASATGTFVANNTAGQTGSLSIPITGATAGTASFSVSGTGFTGSLSTTLTTGQTSVSIPITYDGTGSAGSVGLTITSSEGTGTCTTNVTVTAPVGSFTFNCGTASATGTFVANNTAGQTGSLSIPITAATAGSASFSVSGAGFTGSLSTTLTAGQTSVSIPVTYDGTGSAGSVVLTITSAQGTGTCTTNVTVTASIVDTDGDGVTDAQEVIDGTSPTDPCAYNATHISQSHSTTWNALDCDGDGVINGTEVVDGTNPQNGCSYTATHITVAHSTAWNAGDCDADGLSNGAEITAGTNPLIGDTDGDGFLDGVDACPTVAGVAPSGCPAVVLGGSYNPFVTQGTVTPSPLYNTISQGTGQLSFIIGNSGDDDMPLIVNQEMLVVVTLSRGIPNNIDPIAAIGGTYKSYFNWFYDSVSFSYLGVQNQLFPGALNGGAGTITIDYAVTSNSISTSPQNGFNINITPPAYTNGINSLNDDYGSSYTWTISKLVPHPDFGVAVPNVPLTGDLSTNDVIITGTTYSNPPANPNNPSSCSPVVASNGTYTFTCSTPGEYNFLVPVCEPSPSTECVDVPLQITVTSPVNPTNGPIANLDAATTMQDSPITVNVLSNDACMNGASCTLSNPTIVTGPSASGATAVVNANGTITVTPGPGYTGKDSLQYSVCDNQTPTAKCDTEWVYITVLPAASPNSTNAGDDFGVTPYGTALNGNVKTNDTDPEGNTQTVTAQTTTLPGKGTLTLTTSGTYTFTPAPGYSGPADFPYTTCDNGTPQACATGTIHILVESNTQVLTPDIAVTTPGTPLTGNVSTNDTPIPGSTYSNPPANPGNPSSCSPVVASNGSYTFTCTTPGEYNFLVPVCEPSPSTICVSVPLQITVTAPPSPTAGPIANPDVATTLQGTPTTITPLANDACMNGSGCTLSNPTIVTNPAISGSTATVNPNGTITFTPAPGFTGKDSILYSVCDNQTPTAKCDSEWIYVTVLPTGTPNTTNAGDDFATTPYGTALNGNVKTNDTDPEGNTQTVTAQTTTLPGKGTLTFTTTGTYTFTPAPGYSGPADFPYTTCDNGTPQACATGTIHILVQSNTEVLTPDFAVTTPGTPLTGNVSTNDTPIPGSTYGNPPANPGNPSTCSPVVASNGTYTFTCTTPGEYNFLVPVCEPSPSTICVSVPLQITVTAPPSPTAGPIANPDVATTLQGTPTTITPLANDACMNGTGCTLSNPTIVSGPSASGSTATVNPNGTITFTPATGFTGKDSILYAVCDNQTPTAKCDSEWIYLTVLPTGTPNTTNAADDFATTPYGTALNGNVKTNDTDPEGNTQTVTAQTTTLPGKGTLTLTTSGTYTFTPTPGYSGPADFPYTTCDNGTPQACATGTIHILVQSNTQVLTPDIAVTTPGTPTTGNVSTNDTPIPGSTYGNPPANPGNPSTCSPVVASNGSYTFTCTTPGEYNFLVPVCEPSPSTICVSVPLQITVTAPPSPTAGPIANPDVATTLQGTPTTITPLANDACMNGASCTLSNPTIVSGPSASGSTATVNPNGTITFTPATGFTGKDSILYAVCDNQTPTAKCDSEWIYVTVLPTGTPNTTNAADDFATTPYGTALNGNVKTNDTDPEGNTQTVTAQTTTLPGKGTLTLTTSGTYTFTPTPGYSGPADFPYTTCDNGTPQACATGTIHILVQSNTQVLTPDFAVTTPGTPLTGNVSTNDTPIPGSTYGNPPANPGNPSTCSPVVASNGTYTFTCTTPGEYNFLVPVCEPSPSTICVSVPLQITVTAPPSPTAGPIANPDVATTLQGTPTTITPLANDACMNGASCTLSNPTIVSGPSASGSTATVNPNGTITFTPATGFTGKDSILYSVCDNQTPTAKCDTEWIYVTVLPTNSPNTTNAADDFSTTPYGTALNGNVTTNDTDPEGNTQTVTAQTTTLPGKGTLTLTTSGTYTFTPAPGYSGPADFPYTTCDNGTPQACATGTIHILVQSNTQVLTPDIAVTTPGTPLTGNVSTNDTPIPGSTYGNPPANPGNPSTCSPVVASNGTYTFTCTTPGEYNFLVPVCEPSPSTICVSVPLQITVTAPPSPTAGPIANPDVATTLQGTPTTITPLGNDACMNGTGCTLSNPTIVSGPSASGSTATVNPNGTITFTPATGFTGKDSILYSVCDNQTPTAKCDSEWIYVTVLPTGTPNTTNAADDFLSVTSSAATSGNVKTNDTDPEGNTQTVTAQTTTLPGKGTLVLTSTGSYTFTPVSGFTGPVEFIYTTCDNGTPQACATATLHIVVQPGAPDLTPNITIIPNVMHGITTFNVTVRVTELNSVTTNGLITVRIPKDTRVSFTYNSAATLIGFTPVSNSTWTYNSSNPFFHVFTRSAAINANSFSTFGFVASFNPANSDGKYSMTSTISSGSGGENKATNNSDSESADYFHN